MDKLDHELKDKEDNLKRSRDEVAELEKEFSHREGQLRVIDFED